MERRNNVSPLVDLKLLAHRSILLSNILSVSVGFWTFIIFYTIPILARSPAPYGFGISPIDTSYLLLPFAIVSLILGPTSGYIVSRVGSILPVLFGTILVCGGFVSLIFFYYSAFFLPIDLIIVSAGIALTNVGSQNIVMQSTPRQSTGMSLAMTSLLKLIGSAMAHL
ncbi:MAG TPA: MFS transporter [Candidatus Nitrosocosmicus sp.]